MTGPGILPRYTHSLYWVPQISSTASSPSDKAPAVTASPLHEEALIEAASNSRQLVECKARFIVQRFIKQLDKAVERGFPELRGMVVVRSRQHVLWYTQALREELAQSEAFKFLAGVGGGKGPGARGRMGRVAKGVQVQPSWGVVAA